MAGPSRAETIYEPGTTVAPGFIDLHVHGALGRDVMEGTGEALGVISKNLARHGVTSFFPTTVSAPVPETERAVRGISEHIQSVEGAAPLGIHLEGPYLNPARRGSHDANCLMPADLEAFARFMEASRNTIRRITVAPESDPGLRLIREAVRLGIRVSLGHSDCSADEAAAVEAGASQATHTFNAMRPLHHRAPGVLGQVLIDDRVAAEAIADGLHVHESALRLLYRMKGARQMLLISDGISAVDMPDGRYALGEGSIFVNNGVSRDSEGNLAGSTLTLDRAIQNMVAWLGLKPHVAVEMATASPASSMQIDERKGSIRPGADADLVFLDSKLQVVRTMVAGRTVYP